MKRIVSFFGGIFVLFLIALPDSTSHMSTSCTLPLVHPWPVSFLPRYQVCWFREKLRKPTVQRWYKF